MPGKEKRTGVTGGALPLFLSVCVTVLAVLVAAGPLWGEDMKLWPDGAPGAKGTEKNDIPTLKIFPSPKDVKGPAPAVLLIPGGGYKHISGYGTFWEFFQTRPVRFFSMKYRLPVHGYRHPAPLQDAKRAVATIRANAKKWNIDPKRVVVVAFSSGGHVATTLATHYDLPKPDAKDPVERFSSRPDYMALFCPVVSMKNHPHRPSVARLLGADPDVKLIDDLSNELQVNAKTPPTFLAHAKDDGLVPPENSILYHEALKKAGVATTLKLYRQGGHGVTKKPNPWKAHLGTWMSEIGILPEGAARPAPRAAKTYEPTTSYTACRNGGRGDGAPDRRDGPPQDVDPRRPAGKAAEGEDLARTGLDERSTRQDVGLPVPPGSRLADRHGLQPREAQVRRVRQCRLPGQEE